MAETVDRWQAQYTFWSSFGVPAYEEHAAPDQDDRTYPYITYQAAGSPFGGRAAVKANIWTRSPSWEQADGLSDTIEARINGGAHMPFTGGSLWITPEDPFSVPADDPDDKLIRRKILSAVIHF